MQLWLEMVGYLGSLLVIVSMLMTSVVRLRIINIIGGVISTVYALLIHTYPVAIMNICLIVINLFNLYRLLRSKREFEIVKSTGKDTMVQYFLRHNGKDIKNYFPDFSPESAQEQTAYVVCCNGDPAGILLGRQEQDGTVYVDLDYAVPAYRDCSVGGYLYKNLSYFGVIRLISEAKTVDSHLDYLKKMGFTRTNTEYIKYL